MRWCDLPCWQGRDRLSIVLVLLWSLSAWATPHRLVIGHSADASHLDPHYSTLGADITVYGNLYDTLIRRDGHRMLVPGLATSWARINDTTWRFALREGVVFHTGDPLTAADVQFSLERAAADNPRPGAYPTFRLIEQVEALEPCPVQILTQRPDPLLVARLASHGGMVIPQRYFERVGTEGFRKAPIGRGAVKFVGWRQEERLGVVTNPGYWRASIPYAEMLYKPYPETADRIAALLTGAVNIIADVPPDQLDGIEESTTAKVEAA